MSSLTLLSKSSNPSRTLLKPHEWQQIFKQIPKEAIVPKKVAQQEAARQLVQKLGYESAIF